MPSPKSGKPSDDWSSATTRFLLFLLRDEGYVEPFPTAPGKPNRKGWRLTEKTLQEWRSRDGQEK